MKSYFFGLAALILVSVALPVDVSSWLGVNLNAAFPLAALICGVWLIRILVLRHTSDFEPSGPVIAAVTLAAIACLSFAAGQYPYFRIPGAPLGAQVAGLGLIVLSCGLFLVAGHQIRQVVYLRRLTWLFLIAGGYICLAHVVPGLAFAAGWSGAATIGSMFWIWFVALSCSHALFNLELSTKTRLALLCLTAAAVYRGFFLAGSWASGWLPPLVAMVTILLFRVPRTVFGLGFVAIPTGLLIGDPFYRLIMANEQYSWMSRWEAWRILLEVFEKNPLIGLGPSNYHAYTTLYPILGWYVSFNSHNNYIDLLMQTGIVGLLAFFWLMVEVLRILLRLARSEASGSFPRAYAIGAIGGLMGALAAGMLGDWILPFYYNVGVTGFRSSLLFWVFLGGALALKHISARQIASHELHEQY